MTARHARPHSPTISPCHLRLDCPMSHEKEIMTMKRHQKSAAALRRARLGTRQGSKCAHRDDSCAFSTRIPSTYTVTLLLLLLGHHHFPSTHAFSQNRHVSARHQPSQCFKLLGWVQDDNGEWVWEEDDPAFLAAEAAAAAAAAASRHDPSADSSTPIDGSEALKYSASATPTLPSGSFRPKQSLGQNFLRDGNTVMKIVRAFGKDASETIKVKADGKTMIEGEVPGIRLVELGPGPGALTDPLVETFGTDVLQCIEIDPRSVEMLGERHPNLRVRYEDVLQTDYPELAEDEGGPLSVIGNLPYYITSQILFALADASHTGAVRSATVTMQYEVAERIVSPTKCKAYGILSVVFQLYADCTIHFKIPPTVFYPQPKVDSALVGLRFIGPNALRQRLAGVRPADLRRVLTATFQQRRKTVRNGLKKLAIEVCGGDKEAAKKMIDSSPLPLPKQILNAKENGDSFAMSQELPKDWASKRPEELSPGQFVELTRLIFGPAEGCGDEGGEPKPLGRKIWRKLKHGT